MVLWSGRGLTEKELHCQQGTKNNWEQAIEHYSKEPVEKKRQERRQGLCKDVEKTSESNQGQVRQLRT